jgi:hypothetical protein
VFSGGADGNARGDAFVGPPPDAAPATQSEHRS